MEDRKDPRNAMSSDQVSAWRCQFEGKFEFHGRSFFEQFSAVKNIFFLRTANHTTITYVDARACLVSSHLQFHRGDAGSADSEPVFPPRVSFHWTFHYLSGSTGHNE